MLSPITDKQAVHVASLPAVTDAKTVVVAQDPSNMVAGKLRIVFYPGDLPGTPDALKLDGKVYAIERRIAPFGGPGGGVQGGSLYFQVDVPPFKKDGEHVASVRCDNAWLPLTLNVLIALR